MCPENSFGFINGNLIPAVIKNAHEMPRGAVGCALQQECILSSISYSLFEKDSGFFSESTTQYLAEMADGHGMSVPVFSPGIAMAVNGVFILVDLKVHIPSAIQIKRCHKPSLGYLPGNTSRILDSRIYLGVICRRGSWNRRETARQECDAGKPK